MKIAANTVAGFTYRLTNSEGQELDASTTPLDYLHGHKNIIPGLEKALEGSKVGDKKQVTVAPEEAYGTYDETLLHKYPKTVFPEDVTLELGMELDCETENGVISYIVNEILEDEVLLDANHPLAGETLHFDVEITSVREATSEELEHGHAHSPGGHHHHHH
ncbi:MAG: peptidylprolyl isomerase [Candidatus Margulisiibacteriota bacterium]